MSNTETLFSSISADDMKEAATRMIHARRVYLLGMGCYPLMLMSHAWRSEAAGTIDDLSGIGPKDVLLAATYRPYRRETVELVGAGGNADFADGQPDRRRSRSATSCLRPTSTPHIYVIDERFAEALLAFLVAESDAGTLRRGLKHSIGSAAIFRCTGMAIMNNPYSRNRSLEAAMYLSNPTLATDENSRVNTLPRRLASPSQMSRNSARPTTFADGA